MKEIAIREDSFPPRAIFRKRVAERCEFVGLSERRGSSPSCIFRSSRYLAAIIPADRRSGTKNGLLGTVSASLSSVMTGLEKAVMIRTNGEPLLFPLFVRSGLIDEYGQSLVDSDRMGSGS
jgi:hypothetical protein